MTISDNHLLEWFTYRLRPHTVVISPTFAPPGGDHHRVYLSSEETRVFMALLHSGPSGDEAFRRHRNMVLNAFYTNLPTGLDRLGAENPWKAHSGV